ncbi:MAG: large conductance mechanosensitive channel [Neolewinella sp.]|jgi:large conductance mechanosensitive channel
MGKFIDEFKKFAVKGNMIDLAIGIIIGAAFNKIVTVLVEKIIMPPLGFITAGIDLRDLQWVLSPPVKEGDNVIDTGVVIGYGALIEALMDFGIVALTLFFVVRVINTLKEKAEDEGNIEIPTPKDIQLLSEIRDEMRKMNTVEE